MMREAVLDANVLLRYLTNSPRQQAIEVARILETARERGIELVVSALTMAEVVFVLESVYKWERHEISDGLSRLIAADVLHILEREILVQALSWYREIAAVHFADAYVAAVASSRGHATVISFDRGLRKAPGLTLINAVDMIDDDN